jgi:hypothetical protein
MLSRGSHIQRSVRRELCAVVCPLAGLGLDRTGIQRHPALSLRRRILRLVSVRGELLQDTLCTVLRLRTARTRRGASYQLREMRNVLHALRRVR